jgi:hypothetical protein
LADEVISQVLDGRVGVTGNGGLRVVTDDDGLLGLGDRDTFSALVILLAHIQRLSGPLAMSTATH